MNEDRLRLFLDTNVFIQLRDIKDLPWGDLLPSVKFVDLYVAPIVISELDQHKSGTNKRRRDRSRAALRLIEEASRTPGLTLIVREQPITVRLLLSNAGRPDWPSYELLDPSRADDQLIAELLSANIGAGIFSHDTGPRIRARALRLPAFSPPEDWHLPPEQTDDQRKIFQLERQLDQALSDRPNIRLTVGKEPIGTEITCIVPRLSPLPEDAVNELAARVLTMHPRECLEFNPLSQLLSIGFLSEERIKRYHADFDAFEVAVRQFFRNLHRVVQSSGRAVEIPYAVENESGVSALGLRIECSVDKAVSLIAKKEASPYYTSLTLPIPPEKPKLNEPWNSPLSSLNSSIPFINQERDPTSFYWMERPKAPAYHSALQCAEFRATRIVSRNIYLFPIKKPPITTRLHVQISASNLPKPVEMACPVRIDEEDVDWKSHVVSGILPDSIRTMLSNVL